MPYKAIHKYFPLPVERKKLKKNKDFPRKDQELPWPKDVHKYEPNIVGPDGMAIVRIAKTTYRERLTGVILKADRKAGIIKDHKFYGKGSIIRTYNSFNWRLIFPETGIELRVKTRREGMQILWEIREALKRVMERYFVSTRSPDGRIRAYMYDPDPFGRHIPKRRRKLGALGSPTFMACV